ncbi:hypothetical protein [Arthrobacter cheniae]|uniref:hypothetical protein n=1 Tax=Arthrobacter cheniae TaxID=1258888 RepID=UPI001601673C|nr:hypothetical protein [Arthrobacter cheniae]
MSTRITPFKPFPEDLNVLQLVEVEVLNSKLHRELDYEYVHEDGPSLETESRLEDVTEELDVRDIASAHSDAVISVHNSATESDTDSGAGPLVDSVPIVCAAGL